MEPQVNAQAQITTRSVGVRFGLIAALISIVYFLVLNISGIDMTRGVWNWVGYVITAVLIFFAHKQFKERGDSYMSYGQGIGIAAWMGLVSAVITSVFTYLYIKFIDASFLDLIKEKQLEEMQKQGLSDEQIDQAMQVASMFTSAEAIFFFGLIGGVATAVVIALIVTIFTQKKNTQPVF